MTDNGGFGKGRPVLARMDDQVWKSEALSKRYLEGVRGAIPLAREQLDLIVRITARALPGVKRFLDLGCGDGVIGRTVAAAYPNATGVFLDFSESMLNAAREKPPRAGAPEILFLCEDYGKPG
jgi:tRNA (cmo5U34)-methyltransferase